MSEMTAAIPRNSFFMMAPAGLLAQRQDLRLKFCSRSEQVDEHPPDQSAKVPHQATTSPDSRSSASRMRFATGTTDRHG
jgi:hypothetical protein